MTLFQASARMQTAFYIALNICKEERHFFTPCYLKNVSRDFQRKLKCWVPTIFKYLGRSGVHFSIQRLHLMLYSERLGNAVKSDLVFYLAYGLK